MRVLTQGGRRERLGRTTSVAIGTGGLSAMVVVSDETAMAFQLSTERRHFDVDSIITPYQSGSKNWLSKSVTGGFNW